MSFNKTILETMTAMISMSIENVDFSPRELMLIRLTAFAASDAPVGVYIYNKELFELSGIGKEDVQSLLILALPIIGTARTTTAINNIEKAFGFALEEHRALD